MKHALSLLLCLPLWAPAQTERGAAPLTSRPSPRTAGMTRAVVIGISGYQDNQIPDLHFADADAKAFAGWLRSPAGGSVPEENITLLINEKATNSAVALMLDDLAEACKPGEQAIIYFSGHGDVETKTAYNLGFLLCWDSPAQNYKAGAYPLYYLQAVISTLSAKNVKVTVVTDACHSGKLAGQDVGGAYITGQNLAKPFGTESKILSCQPNEFSHEGEQWGGRGVFSYFLVKGLTGLADKNNDHSVSLFEIQKYLQDAVPAETDQGQMPFTVGNLQTVVASVDAPSLERLRQEEAVAQTDGLKHIDPKGLEDDVLAKADPATRQDYQAFKNALAAGDLIAPSTANAWDLFQKLASNQQLEPLHRLMRRNLATALLDEVQQALNALIDADPYAYNKWYYEPSRFTQYPEYLQRTMDLLGENHYLRHSLIAKKLYFEALNQKKSITDTNLPGAVADSLRAQVKSKLLEAIGYENRAAYLYHAIGSLYIWNNQTDSVILYCSKAAEYSPQWLLPYLDVSYDYQLSQNDFIKSGEWLEKALAISPDSYVTLERLSWLRQWQNRTDESLEISRRMIAMKPDLFNAYGTAGVTSLMRKEFAQAEQYFHEMAALSKSYNNDYYQYWINLLIRTRRLEEGIAMADKIMADDSTEFVFKNSVAVFCTWACLHSGEIKLAEKYADQILSVKGQPYYESGAICVIAWLSFQKGNIPEARRRMQEAMKIQAANPLVVSWQARLEAHIAEMEGRTASADSLFRQALRYPPSFPAHEVRLTQLWEAIRLDYGQFLLRHHRLADARQQFQTLLDTEPLGYHGYCGMALLTAAEGKKDQALDFLEKSLDYYYPSAQPILKEPLFKKLRKTKRFKALLTKYFPETSKQ